MSFTKLSEMDSNYVGSPKAWRDFFMAWEAKRVELYGHERYGRFNFAEPSSAEALTDLSLDFPRSYRDFLLATNCQLPEWFLFAAFNAVSYEEKTSVIYDFEDGSCEYGPVWCGKEIGVVQEVFPEIIWSNENEHIPDEEYYVYEYNQDASSARMYYVSQSLCVAKWADEGCALLLNPFEKTKDGEWETWILDPKAAGAYRFPSFAHLAIRIYIEDILRPEELDRFPWYGPKDDPFGISKCLLSAQR